MSDTRPHPIERLLQERILVLDGAMGTMIQRYRLEEPDYRGERFRDHPVDLKDANDAPEPDPARGHRRRSTRQYLEAGADIIETNTFNANSVSLGRLRLERLACELNLAAARIARAGRRRGRWAATRAAALRGRRARADQPDGLDVAAT